MTNWIRNVALFAAVATLFIATGFVQSWNVTLTIVNMALISAIMALGVNLQWGYAGLFNFGVLGFVALGGLAAVLISMPPVGDAWAVGGAGIMLGLAAGAMTILLAVWVWRCMAPGRRRGMLLLVLVAGGYALYRAIIDPATAAVEAVDPAAAGYLGGLGLPVLMSWPAGALLAGGTAWLIGKIALGLRADYLAIATLGIAEIVIAVLKNEDWLARGVANVIGVPRPVPYEVDLQRHSGFAEWTTSWGLGIVEASSVIVKLCYAGLFLAVLAILIWLAEMALKSPWGRMMRAIRDNATAAAAMGKAVRARHLQIFVLGSAVCGLAGAMMVTLDGQLTPGTYQPLRFTFLIWVMVIVGGSGNNWGAVLGGFLIWWLWVMVEPIGFALMQSATFWIADGTALKARLFESTAYMRLLTMGILLLFVLRFYPRGLIPEGR
ncbi:MAG: branched-chain amino acid ABC transporter permease [Pararhodobacter sp.]|nr:branched-chain amino acid ABC transporter permease [Pararhodobacter sp.]